MSAPTSNPGLSWRRLRALCYKESLQILRDPSSNVIAFVLPIVMLIIFGFGINLDSNRIKVGLFLKDTGREARQYADSLFGSPYLEVHTYNSERAMEHDLMNCWIRGFIVLDADFGAKLNRPGITAPIQVVTDGTEPNIAAFIQSYAEGATQQWVAVRAAARGEIPVQKIGLETRTWFNPSNESRNFLLPGSITIIMTVIGALLTSLVVAREWERGTMEALLASPMTKAEFLLSKIIPYYGLGMISLLICVSVTVFVLGVPFRGSLIMLVVVSSFFLLSVLGIGLLLSTGTRNQFNAAQGALNAAFLPALMLSGYLYEISSMPAPIRTFTYLIPARYFVSAIQTLFQAGDVLAVLWPSTLFLIASSVFFLGLTVRITRHNLEK